MISLKTEATAGFLVFGLVQKLRYKNELIKEPGFLKSAERLLEQEKTPSCEKSTLAGFIFAPAKDKNNEIHCIKHSEFIKNRYPRINQQYNPNRDSAL